MELQEIFKMQKGLDQHIEKKHGLEQSDLFDQKVLALLVEIGELANETRSFKFWSLKSPSPQEVILEEFVDGIHFMVSLGLNCGFEKIEVISSRHSKECTMTEQFLTVYESVQHFRKKRTVEAYKKMFEDYLFLASLLGFKDEDIKEAYIKKNEVNYKRQQDGY
ncbi:dUTP diphosphatase [Bacillus dakarensis]|uniref:dUTP diphosphatase n=1 Tax=Robertmurraya dakarensis TaxID=1926278 RepID=UPI00098194A6|nr:dUTP diphosphatase [Bacillus dakarensis]